MRAPDPIIPYEYTSEYRQERQSRWELSIRIASQHRETVDTIKEFAVQIYELLNDRPREK